MEEQALAHTKMPILKAIRVVARWTTP